MGTTPTYLKDHQGNNRVVINQSGTVQQVSHYCPFGGLFGEGLQTSNQPYRYNGKELDRQLDLDLYDYGARHYDAALGRWLTVDPLAEVQPNKTPYHYCSNNPITRIDPTGMLDGDYYDKQRNWLYNDGIDDGKVYEVSQMPGVSLDIEGSGVLNVEYVGQVENVKLTFT